MNPDSGRRSAGRRPARDNCRRAGSTAARYALRFLAENLRFAIEAILRRAEARTLLRGLRRRPGNGGGDDAGGCQREQQFGLQHRGILLLIGCVTINHIASLHEQKLQVTARHASPYLKRMSTRFDAIPNRRAIIDRRAVADALAALPGEDRVLLRRQTVPILKAALDAGRVEIERRLIEHPSRGLESAGAQAFLTDQLLRLIYDFTVQRLYPGRQPDRAASGSR